MVPPRKPTSLRDGDFCPLERGVLWTAASPAYSTERVSGVTARSRLLHLTIDVALHGGRCRCSFVFLLLHADLVCPDHLHKDGEERCDEPDDEEDPKVAEERRTDDCRCEPAPHVEAAACNVREKRHEEQEHSADAEGLEDAMANERHENEHECSKQFEEKADALAKDGVDDAANESERASECWLEKHTSNESKR